MKKQVMEQVGRGIRSLSKVLSWVVPAAVLVVALAFMFKGKPDPAAGLPPEQLISRYQAMILPFSPPASALPTEAAWDELLGFFSEESRKWIRQHRDALAWLGMAQDERAFQQADERARLHAAFRFLINQGPVQALTLQQTLARDNDPKRLTLKASSISQRYEFLVVEEKGIWKFEEVWKIPEEFATPIAQFTTRYGTR